MIPTVEDSSWRCSLAVVGVVVSLVFMGASVPFVWASDSGFVIIVHPDNPARTVTRAQLDAMYLGKIESWPDGSAVRPVNNRDEELLEEFCQAIHSRSRAAVDAYWAVKVFRESVAPPGSLEDGEVIEFVRSNPGAIGFVHRGLRLNGVRELKIVE